MEVDVKNPTGHTAKQLEMDTIPIRPLLQLSGHKPRALIFVL